MTGPDFREPGNPEPPSIPYRVGRYYDHAYLLEHFASWIRPRLYVELGTADYRTFRRVAVHCQTAVAVDLRPPGDLPAELQRRCRHFQTETSQFLRDELPRLGSVEMAFIDADHQAEVAFADFCGIWQFVALNGLVFLHDTFPPDRGHLEPDLCDDSWRVPQMIHREFGTVAEVLTLPFPPG